MASPTTLSDHPRRCKANTRRGRCWNWALVGASNCKWHSGRQQQKARVGTNNISKLPVFYSKHLTKTLKDHVSDSLGMDPDEQVALYEELALVRHVAGQFVKLYGAACDSGNPETVMLAASGMVDALNNVERICSAAGKLKDKQKDRFSIHDLKFVVDQLVQIMYTICDPDHRDIAVRFKESVDSYLVLPTAQQGTDLHPDQTAALLDSSIPEVDDDDDDDD